jgi:hypothetical protein
MALSQIIGLVLVVIGVVMYAFSIWGYYQKRTQKQRGGLSEIKETLDALTKLLEAFAKFSDDMQFLLVATGILFAGLYLLQNKPF